ncbi:MAG: hypothetical protein S4CHLAM81_02380 [Chlamydiales bacterium]|nr:hypothetical protein [Chlamydiales bacterium]MCH9635030.1 hypothetical protein [Chlamydiales bacterium]
MEINCRCIKGSLRKNPGKVAAIVLPLFIAAALVAATFIPATRGTMQNGWHKVGSGFKFAAHKVNEGFTSKGGLGKGLRIGSAVVGGISGAALLLFIERRILTKKGQ